MTEQEIDDIKEKYESFENELKDKMKDKQICKFNKECYLINECWINDFNNSYELYQNSKKHKSRYNKTNTSFSLPKKNPEFLNDIASIIDYVKNGNKFIPVNKELMEFVFKNNKKELTKNNFIYYYTGNNKIIMEFRTRNENNALLLLFNIPIKDKKDVYLIERTIKEKDYKLLYEDILNNFKSYLINNEKYKNKIKTKAIKLLKTKIININI